jgi:hypothetical protein
LTACCRARQETARNPGIGSACISIPGYIGDDPIFPVVARSRVLRSEPYVPTPGSSRRHARQVARRWRPRPDAGCRDTATRWSRRSFRRRVPALRTLDDDCERKSESHRRDRRPRSDRCSNLFARLIYRQTAIARTGRLAVGGLNYRVPIWRRRVQARTSVVRRRPTRSFVAITLNSRWHPQSRRGCDWLSNVAKLRGIHDCCNL